MARFDCAEWRPLPESGTQSKIRPTQVIFHTAVDAPGPTNLGGYFARADIALESHFWSPLSGRLQQLMDTEERADANLYANRRTDGTGAISVETEDEGNPEGVPWNAKQLDDLVAVGVEAHVRHGIPVKFCESPSDPGFGWHSMWGAPSAWTPSAGKTCPGSTRIAQIPEVMRRIAAHVEDDMPTIDEIRAAVAAENNRVIGDLQSSMKELLGVQPPQNLLGEMQSSIKVGAALSVEGVRGSLAALDDVVLSDEQVRSIIDAMPQAVKQALREGAG